MKKVVSVIICIALMLGSLSVFADNTSKDEWVELYAQKTNEIIAEYKSGVRSGSYSYEGWGDKALYFALQDINFDGVPELYHSLCSWFELEPWTTKDMEEIYYIRDGKVLKGEINSEYELFFLPLYRGEKPTSYQDNRWRGVMKDISTGEVCFISNDSHGNGMCDFYSVTYMKYVFDEKTGVLSTDVLIRQDEAGPVEYGYEEPKYLTGYECIGLETHYFTADSDDWGIDSWNSIYKAPEVLVDGECLEFDRPPVIVNGRTLTPVRKIAEALGADVKWNELTQEVIVEKDNKTIIMVIGDSKYTVDGQAKELDVPAQIMSGRTFIPARALSEAFDCNVDWIENTQTVVISK